MTLTKDPHGKSFVLMLLIPLLRACEATLQWMQLHCFSFDAVFDFCHGAKRMKQYSTLVLKIPYSYETATMAVLYVHWGRPMHVPL